MISKEKAIKAQLDLNFLVDKAKFISDGTWFDLNTEATIIGSLSPTWDKEDNLVGLALFKGIRQGKPDKEVCSLSEFDVWKEGHDHYFKKNPDHPAENMTWHDAVAFCKQNGVEFYAVNKNFPEEELDNNTSRKVNADVFIDDRNVGGFMGWGEIWQQLNVDASASEKQLYWQRYKKAERSTFCGFLKYIFKCE